MDPGNCDISEFIGYTGKGCVLELYVVPHSSSDHFVVSDGELVFYSSSSCKGHGVNYGLIRWFKRSIGVEPVIVRGWSSRSKILLFPGLRREELAVKLRGLITCRDGGVSGG
ncbi:MAG: hypothetical protein F7B59_02460 [Desulfurococcales archaeon]|nr:hypothetical protein [Desulfurococcales archaeon]